MLRMSFARENVEGFSARMTYVLKWKDSSPPVYYFVDTDNPERLCGCYDIRNAAQFSCKEDAESLPLALPLSDGKRLWDLYDLVSLNSVSVER